jgi:hypothetical protein
MGVYSGWDFSLLKYGEIFLDFLLRYGGNIFFNLIKYKVVYDFIIYIFILYFSIFNTTGMSHLKIINTEPCALGPLSS